MASSVAAPVLSRIQFGHCPRFHLQRGITVVYIGGQPSLRRRAQSRSAASAINLISNALSASVSTPLPSFSSSSSSSALSQQTSLFSYILLLVHGRPLQPLDEQEFSILSSTAGKQIAGGPRPPSRDDVSFDRRNFTFTCTDPRDQDAFSEIARYVTHV